MAVQDKNVKSDNCVCVFMKQIDEDKRKDSTYFRQRGRYDKKVTAMPKIHI